MSFYFFWISCAVAERVDCIKTLSNDKHGTRVKVEFIAGKEIKKKLNGRNHVLRDYCFSDRDAVFKYVFRDKPIYAFEFI